MLNFDCQTHLISNSTIYQVSFSTIVFAIIDLIVVEIIANDNTASIVTTKFDKCSIILSNQIDFIYYRSNSIFFLLMLYFYKFDLQKQILSKVFYINYIDTIQALNLIQIIYKTRVIIKSLRYIVD